MLTFQGYQCVWLIFLSPIKLSIEPGTEEVFTWEQDRDRERKRGRMGIHKISLLDAAQQLDLVVWGNEDWVVLPFRLRQWETGYSFLLDTWHLSWTEHRLLFKLCIKKKRNKKRTCLIRMHCGEVWRAEELPVVCAIGPYVCTKNKQKDTYVVVYKQR